MSFNKCGTEKCTRNSKKRTKCGKKGYLESRHAVASDVDVRADVRDGRHAAVQAREHLALVRCVLRQRGQPALLHVIVGGAGPRSTAAMPAERVRTVNQSLLTEWD